MSGARSRTVVLVAALVAGVLAPSSLAAGRTAPRKGPSVVVAVADTGVNPYHEVFYRPRNTAHPCTWVVGFTDCSVPALKLSVGKFGKYEQALEADADVWADVEPGQWYWIPRTNIIGAVCDTFRGGSATASDPTCILDDDGHGTGTASSVLSEAPDALLLIHDGKSSARHLATAPVTPDVRSHSWGPPAPLPLHATSLLPGEDSSPFCDNGYAPQTVFFLAAGNEAPYPTMLDCSRQPIDVQVVGGSFPGYWNYDSWSGYDFASWFCRPFASHVRVREDEVEPTRGCGTSFAAPTAAGTAADAMLQLRRRDRYAGRSSLSHVTPSISREAFIQALRDGASYNPEGKFDGPEQCDYVLCYYGWAPMAPGTEHVHWGYGWLDSTVTQAVVNCAVRRGCPPKSAEAKEYNERRQAARQSTSNDVVPAAPQDDAGSRRDAATSYPGAVRIRPGVAYDGHVEPYVASGDMEDWYVFRAKAGQKISLTSSAFAHGGVPVDLDGVLGCWTIYDTDGKQIGDTATTVIPLYRFGCDSAGVNEPPTDVRAETTGTYLVVYTAHNGVPAHDYRFTLTLGS